MTYAPDLIIDNEMLILVSEIAVLVDRISERSPTHRQIELRRTGRARSIHSSAAIEGNRLSLEDVTDIMDGKRILRDHREVLEIKNAQRACDRMDGYDPFSAEDLLTAHRLMMDGLVDSPGMFRDCGVGVYKGGVPLHIAPEHEDVPHLVSDLMDWSSSSDLHPLILSCIFHCRFEYIHPFVDGNGRMGRLWHSLILSRWRSAFSHLPIENWIYVNRREYYDSLKESDEGNITVFIKFMLRIIKAAVDEFVDEISYAPKGQKSRKESITEIITQDPGATAEKMAGILGVSTRTVKRHLSSMTEAGIIRRSGSDKTGKWETIRKE